MLPEVGHTKHNSRILHRPAQRIWIIQVAVHDLDTLSLPLRSSWTGRLSGDSAQLPFGLLQERYCYRGALVGLYIRPHLLSVLRGLCICLPEYR